MRFFALLDFQHWIVAYGLGLILFIALYVAWHGYPRDREHIDDPFKEVGEDFVPASDDHPIPPLLVFIYVGTVMWIFGYVLVVGILGGPIT